MFLLFKSYSHLAGGISKQRNILSPCLTLDEVLHATPEGVKPLGRGPPAHVTALCVIPTEHSDEESKNQ